MMDVVASLFARQAPSSGPPESTPVLQPPLGVRSNFLNPVSRQQQLIDATIACLVFSVLFLSMRLYTRLSITRSLGFDDWTAILAMAVITAYSGCVLHFLSYGIGKHAWDVTRKEYNRPVFLKWNSILYILYLAAIGTVKISILLLYLRLFSISRATKFSVYACLIFVSSYILAGELSLIFSCQPVKRLFNYLVPGRCTVDIHKHVLSQAILNIISDAMMVAIPAPAAWGLQLPKRQKIAIIAIFGTGSVACVASAFRLHYIKDGNSPTKRDTTWHQFDNYLWSIIELHLAIICSCMPAFKPFLQHYMPFLRKFSSRILSYGSNSARGGSKESKDASASQSDLGSRAKAEFVELYENPSHARFDEENVPYATHPDGRIGYMASVSPRQKWQGDVNVNVSESQERIVHG